MKNTSRYWVFGQRDNGLGPYTVAIECANSIERAIKAAAKHRNWYWLAIYDEADCREPYKRIYNGCIGNIVPRLKARPVLWCNKPGELPAQKWDEPIYW